MDVSEAISKRKSIRAYTDHPVSGTDLKKIVTAGRWAPNAGPFHISVIQNRDLLKKINDRTHDAMVHSDREFLRQRVALPGYQPLYGAAVLIVFSGPADAPNSPLNAALAAENMLIEATGMGLGSCFIVTPTLALNGKDSLELAQAAGIPENYKALCCIILGYAAAENKFSATERTAKGTVNYVE